jgi:hypothetical protein
MATLFSSSANSGYATDVAYFSLGPNKAMTAHYSSPSADTGYIETEMMNVSYVHVQDADPTRYQYSANAIGLQAVYFSGLVVGSTGVIFILGN